LQTNISDLLDRFIDLGKRTDDLEKALKQELPNMVTQSDLGSATSGIQGDLSNGFAQVYEMMGSLEGSMGALFEFNRCLAEDARYGDYLFFQERMDM
jgi:hypothetical protein